MHDYLFHHRFAHLRCSPRQKELAPLEPEVNVEQIFRGERGIFEMCDVFIVTRHDGRDASEEMITTHDWRGEEAVYLAETILLCTYGYARTDLCKAFAEEVLAKLPQERWELSMREVRGWCAEYQDQLERLDYPPRVDHDAEEELPGDLNMPLPEDGKIDEEALDRLKKRLRDLGMLDQDGETGAGEGNETTEG